MCKQGRVPRVGVAAFLLVLAVAGTWHHASVQVPIVITLPTVGETTLFSDNFDTYPVGSFPSAGGWEVVWGGTGQNFIVSDPSVSKPHAFQLWGKPNWSAVVQKKFSTTAPVIGYEFSIRIEKIGTGTPGREESPAFFNRGVATWGGYYAMIQFCHDTRRIKTLDGTVLGQWSPQVWYHVKVVLDRRTNLFSVWINGNLAGQNIKTEGDTYQINALALFSGHPGVKVWYDDVRVFTVVDTSPPGLQATLQTSRGCGASAVFQIGEQMQATFRVEGTGQAYVRLLNILPTETKTVLQGTVNRGDTTTVPGTAGEPAGARLLRLEVWENMLEFLVGRQPATKVECAFTVGQPAGEREYRVRVLQASWEDPTVMVDPPVATMVVLEGSPTGQLGETLSLAWLPGQLRWDTDWPRPAANHAFRIWVAPTEFWGRTFDAVVRWERITLHQVSTPDAPTGPSEGRVGESLSFSVGGGGCSQPGHLVEYRLDWADGTFSGWLNMFALMFSPPTHAWGKEGTYHVRVQTRCAVDTSIVSAWSPAIAVTIRSVPPVAEWHIDFQGDANHGGTYGQADPVAHSQPGVYWNVFEVAALRLPAPTPRTTNPSLTLKDSAGNPTGVRFSIEGDAYGWAGLSGADSLLGDYLIHVNRNAHGVLNNPTWWKIYGLAPDTRYCLTFYHASTGAQDRGLVFGVLHAFHTSLVTAEGTSGKHIASECVTSSGEGTITGWTAVDDRLGFEGNWAGLSIRPDAECSSIECVLVGIEEDLGATIHLPQVAQAIGALHRSRAFFFQREVGAGIGAIAFAASYLEPVDPEISSALTALAEACTFAFLEDGLGGFFEVSWGGMWEAIKRYGGKALEAVKRAKAWLEGLLGVRLATGSLAVKLIYLVVKYGDDISYCYAYCGFLNDRDREGYCSSTDYFTCVNHCLVKERGLRPDEWWHAFKDVTGISIIEKIIELFEYLKGVVFG